MGHDEEALYSSREYVSTRFCLPSKAETVDLLLEHSSLAVSYTYVYTIEVDFPFVTAFSNSTGCGLPDQGLDARHKGC